MWIRRSFVLLFLIFAGYAHGLYYDDSRFNDYLGYLINSGKLNIAHPLSQPFRTQDIDLASYSGERPNDSHFHLFQVSLQQRGDSASNEEFGTLYISSGIGSTINAGADTLDILPFGYLKGQYLYKDLSAAYHIRADNAYKYDTDYFGNAVGKLQYPIRTRTVDSYIGYEKSYISLFFGRVSRNFGLINDPSLILSSNAHSFDHALISIHNRRLKFTSLHARLHDVFGYDIRTEDAGDSYWNKRYLASHRLELSISEKLKLACSESILYGGKKQQPMYQYLNPANVFFMSKLGDRQGYEEGNANALSSIELYYKPKPYLTIFGQFLLDDMDFTKELRERYPDRIGFCTKAIISDLIPRSQLHLTYNRVSNWTYNSFYTFGNYVSYGNSLGFPFHGYEGVSLGADFFPKRVYQASMALSFERYRDQDLLSPFIADKTSFPIGVDQRDTSFRLKLVHLPFKWLYLSADNKLTFISNDQHVSGDKRVSFSTSLIVSCTGLWGINQ